MKVARRGSVVSLVFVALVVPQAPGPSAQAPTITQSLLGMTLSASANQDFFTFFHLEEIMWERDAAGRDVVVFKPSGGTFRRMVTVRATLGPEQRIAQMQLDLARAFIDNPEQRPFASDIASSMLISSLPPGDLEAIGDLVHEIQRRSIRVSGSVAIPRFPPIELPAQESLGFLTYDGRRGSYSQQLPTTVLLMEKAQEAGEAWLRIRLSPKF